MDMNPIKILIVEDDEGLSRLIEKSLRRKGYETLRLSTGHEALEMIKSSDQYLLLLDYHLPDINADEFVEQLSCWNKKVPFIIITGYGDEKLAVEMMKKGARDYLVKDHNFIDLIPQIFSRVFRELENETKLANAERALIEANTNLERRVEERTAELAESNRKLQKEIYEKQQIEQKLTYAIKEAEESNQVKSEFLANVSHEIRNPMHHILSYSLNGIKKLDSAPKEKLLHYFNQISAAGNRLMKLLNDLLDLSKMEAGKMKCDFETADIFTIIEEALKDYRQVIKEKKITLEYQKPDRPKEIQIDAYRISQVVRNLLSNAVKFTPEEKKIRISYETINQSNRSWLRISVHDQGVGIPENELDLVFEKFTQSSKTKTGAGGTGLGLAICKEIVEAHHGNIQAKNNLEGGATITFTLPESSVSDNP